MGFKFSEHVTAEIKGQPVKLLRPGARVQLGWQAFIAQADDRAEGNRLMLSEDELGKIQGDLARYIVAVNGERVEYSDADIDRILSPDEAFNLWCQFYGSCKLPDSEKKRSETPSVQPCTLGDGTTARPAAMLSRSSANAATT
jgi:hypothetical protein